ncbi:hypothetical protein H0I76_15385 [Limibaculum sp. M0105]|uniref:Uncharacterized protein n=1 Tax=Thermohalobaculum xanthum TaxID=2753746 RepID=A0A8J7M936_9RHOB|nr:hypothetical protein [Thermohalobaculum xanthum]MBK0400581.1 hypothetical protein [Thermohalobaculum xanthum]
MTGPADPSYGTHALPAPAWLDHSGAAFGTRAGPRRRTARTMRQVARGGRTGSLGIAALPRPGTQAAPRRVPVASSRGAETAALALPRGNGYVGANRTKLNAILTRATMRDAAPGAGAGKPQGKLDGQA